MRSHLLIVLFHGNENVMHYFCLAAFNIFSFLSTVWQNMSVFRYLFILLEIQWILGSVIFFFSKLGKFSATIYSNVFLELLFSSLAWIFVLCMLGCLIMSPISENVYFCFLNWMIPIDLSSRSLIPSVMKLTYLISYFNYSIFQVLNFYVVLLILSSNIFLGGTDF